MCLGCSQSKIAKNIWWFGMEILVLALSLSSWLWNRHGFNEFSAELNILLGFKVRQIEQRTQMSMIESFKRF